MKISTLLRAIGYDGTEADLETFEKARSFAVTATPDAKTVAALTAAATAAQNPNAAYIQGQKDAVITAAQKNLSKLGYDVGPANGVFDAKLADAVAKFKAAHPELANVGRYIGAPASNAIAAAAAGPAPAKPAASNRSLVIGEISAKAWSAMFPKLQSQLASGQIAKGTSLSVGSYGIDAKMAKDLDVLKSMGANVKYTPTFSLVPPKKDPTGTGWDKRMDGVTGDPKYAGAIPKVADMGSDAQREAWGKELGMRFRDQLAHANASGTSVDGWMLDEVWSSASKDGAPAASLRAFQKGVMEGLLNGRDGTAMKGTVYMANLPALVKAQQTPEMKSFMSTLDAATSQIVQEEYPIFGKGVTGAKGAADNANAADTKLATLGPAGAALAKKVVSGLSPGYSEGALHGQYAEDGNGGWRNLGLTPQQVQQWRKAYMAERENAAVAGFGEYGFVKGNADENVIDGALTQVADELAGS
jgi:hypothetical protein